MHKLIVLALMFAPAVLFAGDGKKQPQEKKPQAAQAAPAKLPEAAVETAPGVYRYTDAQGKVWEYRKTPFGLMKAEVQPDKRAASAADADAAATPDLKVTEDGDTLRFEKPGPFGKFTWTRKKSDQLTDAEKKAWERGKKPAEDNAAAKQEKQEPK